ncbi:MAG TPA: carbohydrate ABC transporter permease [Chthoniobacteraceae bacterium]|nr:carbohydrate ABC transporter permease [Chthoniobacteraceae bacterium]
MKTRFSKTSLWHLPLIGMGLTCLLPLLFMIVTALAPPEQAMKTSTAISEMIIPRHYRWENFVEVWTIVPFLRYYINSVFVALVITSGKVFTSAMAAYAFSRLQWKGRDVLFLLYLATMMIPGSVTMIPNFIIMKLLPELLSSGLPFIDWMGLRFLGNGPNAPGVGRFLGLDSYFALIAPGMFSAYGTFLLRQFFMSLPKDLDEAATIDGCNHWGIFTRVILPLSLPGITTLSIVTFIGAWGSFLWPLVVTHQEYMRTLPVGLQSFQGQYGTEWHLMMAASLLMLLPVMVIFLFGQRFFVSGITSGAVKG